MTGVSVTMTKLVSYFFGSLILCGLFLASSAHAGEADVLKVRAKCKDDNTCRFSVRVRHRDKGWNHYVDRWEVLSLDREILATRVLAHPHVDEQPFTRSLTVEIAPEHKSVIFRAHDSEHGYGGEEMTVLIRKEETE